MGTDPRLLREQCERTLARTDLPALGTKIEGKVRDNYVRGRPPHHRRDRPRELLRPRWSAPCPSRARC